MPVNLKPLIKPLAATTIVSIPTGLYIDRVVNDKSSQTLLKVKELEDSNKTLTDNNKTLQEQLDTEKNEKTQVSNTNIVWGIANPLTNSVGCKKYEQQTVKEGTKDVIIPAYIECYKRSLPDETGAYTNWDITITPATDNGRGAENVLKSYTPTSNLRSS